MRERDSAKETEATDASPDAIVRQLFEAADRRNPQRFLLSLLDLGDFDGRPMLGSERDFAASQLGHLLHSLDRIIPPEGSDCELVTRSLQFIAYSLFWEAWAIQRMMTSLVRTAQGKPYDRLLYERSKRPKTWRIMDTIAREAKAVGLDIGPFLERVYNNQLRNAFVHGQIYFTEHHVWLLNHDPARPGSKSAIALKEWDEVFSKSREFIASLLERRMQMLKRIRLAVPIHVTLPELPRLTITYHARLKRWVSQQ